MPVYLHPGPDSWWEATRWAGRWRPGASDRKSEPQAGDDALGSGDAPAEVGTNGRDPCRTNSPPTRPDRPPTPPEQVSFASRSGRTAARTGRTAARAASPRKGTTHPRLPGQVGILPTPAAAAHAARAIPTPATAHAARATPPSSHRPRSPGHPGQQGQPGQSTCNRVQHPQQTPPAIPPQPGPPQPRSIPVPGQPGPGNPQPWGQQPAQPGAARQPPDRAIPTLGPATRPAGAVPGQTGQPGRYPGQPGEPGKHPGASPAHSSPQPARPPPPSPLPPGQTGPGNPQPWGQQPAQPGAVPQPARPSQGGTRASPAHNSPHLAPQRNHRHPATARPWPTRHGPSRTRTAKRPRRGTRHHQGAQGLARRLWATFSGPVPASQGRAARTTGQSAYGQGLPPQSGSAQFGQAAGSHECPRASRHPSGPPGARRSARGPERAAAEASPGLRLHVGVEQIHPGWGRIRGCTRRVLVSGSGDLRTVLPPADDPRAVRQLRRVTIGPATGAFTYSGGSALTSGLVGGLLLSALFALVLAAWLRGSGRESSGCPGRGLGPTSRVQVVLRHRPNRTHRRRWLPGGTGCCHRQPAVLLPGLIIAFLTQYFMFFILDRDLGVVDSIKASYHFVVGNLGPLIPDLPGGRPDRHRGRRAVRSGTSGRDPGDRAGPDLRLPDPPASTDRAMTAQALSPRGTPPPGWGPGSPGLGGPSSRTGWC